MNILVIKLGALGDFILAQPAFAAIRKAHSGAWITLLTTKPFAEIARASPYFDDIWTDEKPGWLAPSGLLRLRRKLRGGEFSRVYDLQTSDRTALYYRLLGPGRKPEWSGIARGCSHPDPTPDRAAVHSFDLRIAQLHAAGIDDIGLPDLGWMAAKAKPFDLPRRFALLVPGSAPHRPEKRWAAQSFGAFAASLVTHDITPVVIGSSSEQSLASAIQAICPEAIDLTGKTTLFDIAGLASHAKLAVGNDTGPMHLTAAAGTPSLVLFSGASTPSRSSPRGKSVSVLQRDDLNDLTANEVEGAIAALSDSG